MIQLSTYIAHNNTQEAIQYVVSKGFKKPSGMKMLVNQLNYAIRHGGKDALMELAKIHPDYELIIESEKSNKAPDKKMSACGCSMSADGENQYGCAGCGGRCGGSMSCDGSKTCNCNKKFGADGSTTTVKKEETTEEKGGFVSHVLTTDRLAMVAVASLAFIVVYSIATK